MLKYLLIIVAIVLIFFIPEISLAECSEACPEGQVCVEDKCVVQSSSTQSSISKLVESKIDEIYGNKLGIFPASVKPSVIVGKLLKYAFGLLGTAAMVIFIYAGLKLIDSEGKSEKIKEAMRTLVYAAAGIIIIFSSYAVVNYLIQKL